MLLAPLFDLCHLFEKIALQVADFAKMVMKLQRKSA